MPCRSIGSNPSSPVRLSKDIASALPRLCSCVKFNQRNRKAWSTRDVSVVASTAKVRPSRGRGGRGQCQACRVDRAPRQDRGGRGRRRGPLRGHRRATGRCGLIRGRRLRRRTKALLHAVRSVIEAAMRIGGACGGRLRGRSVNGVPSQRSSGSVLGTIKPVTIKSVTGR